MKQAKWVDVKSFRLLCSDFADGFVWGEALAGREPRRRKAVAIGLSDGPAPLHPRAGAVERHAEIPLPVLLAALSRGTSPIGAVFHVFVAGRPPPDSATG